MSIQSEIERIGNNVAATYSNLEDLGADMPQTRNSNNLPETVKTIKAVRYDEQNLTDEQKAQARTNIGAADQTYVDEAILNVQTQDLQFVDSVEEMTDSKKNYVLKETGEIWSCQKSVKSYTNQIPLSLTDDGTAVYNDIGYKNETRYNSSISVVTQSGTFTTGYIPVKPGDIIRFNGNYFNPDHEKAGGSNNRFVDSAFTSVFSPSMLAFKEGSQIIDVIKNADGYITQFTLNPDYGEYMANWENVAYVKLTLIGSGENAIITVNEEMIDSVTYEFAPTCRYYGTESMQIVSSVDEMTDVSKKYVLEETGTIWYYGETSGEEGGVSYINRAEPLPNNTTDKTKWINGYRFSSGTLSDEYTDQPSTVSNSIAVKVGDVVRIKGVTLRENSDRIAIQTKANIDTLGYTIGYFNVGITAGSSTPVVYNGLEDGVYTFTISEWADNEIVYFRFAMPTPTAEDANKIIVTVNEEIVEGGTSKPSYTNQIPLSTDADGNVVGELIDYRYNSSDSLVSNTGTNATGFIPVKFGDIIRFKNIIFNSTMSGAGSIYLRVYKADGSISAAPSALNIASSASLGTIEFDEEGNIASVILSNETYTKDVVKFRIAYAPTDEKAIITVNEEIIEGNTKVPYTNLATNIKENYRLNSSGGETAADGVVVVMDYIEVKTGDVLRIKGLGALTDNNTGYYLSNKTIVSTGIANATGMLGYGSYTYDDATEIVTLTVLKDSIGYVRVSGKPTGTTSDIIITVNEEIVNSSSDSDVSLSWKDSKIKYAGTGNEDTLIEVERRVTKAEGNIKRLANRIDNIKFSDNSSTTEVVEGIPEYWKTAVDSMRDTILAQLDEGGHESFGFTWGADIHGKNGYTNPSNGAGTSVTKNIGHVCQYATEVYDLPFAMFSGDIMSQGSHSKEETVHTEHEDMMEIFSPINFYKLLIEKGNHDGAYGAPVDGVYYLYNIGGKELYNNLFRKQALDRTRVFGGDGSYFYVDTPNNMRVIMLNGHTTGDDSVDENGYAVYNSMKYGVYGNEQLEWLANEALNTNKRIIVSAHQPLTQSMDGSILAGILNAYNNRTSYKGSKDVTAEYWGNGVSDNTYTMISIEKDFTSAKGKVIAYFHGHIHKDTIDNTTNTFIVASITTAGADVRDTNPPLRTAGTATETALDIVIITDEKIYFNRLGAGESREVALK